ncbi:MAG: elongation factor P [Candidatus Omnitrophica bacterium]|nr:elongation factor P [Candidatus Omnitrophota bacterium]
MISANQIKTGMVIKLEGKLYAVVGFTHTKPGKGGAFLRIKMKDISSGQTLERTISTDQKIDDAYVEEKKLTYLYYDSQGGHFMDDENFEEVVLSQDDLEGLKDFLKESSHLDATVYEGRIVALSLPLFVELEITDTQPGFKGDTVKAGTKQAKLETGAFIQVPLFIDKGDVIKIDTRTGEYVERV